MNNHSNCLGKVDLCHRATF